MGDKNAVGPHALAILQAILHIFFNAVGQLAPVFFLHAHGPAAHFDAGLDAQQIGSQRGGRGAAAALLHVIQPIQHKAGLHPTPHFLQAAENLHRAHAFFR